jgi:hypothetical protein
MQPEKSNEEVSKPPAGQVLIDKVRTESGPLWAVYVAAQLYRQASRNVKKSFQDLEAHSKKPVISERLWMAELRRLETISSIYQDKSIQAHNQLCELIENVEGELRSQVKPIEVE